ncbi:mCG144947, partial [Mus musculus]
LLVTSGFFFFFFLYFSFSPSWCVVGKRSSQLSLGGKGSISWPRPFHSWAPAGAGVLTLPGGFFFLQPQTSDLLFPHLFSHLNTFYLFIYLFLLKAVLLLGDHLKHSGQPTSVGYTVHLLWCLIQMCFYGNKRIRFILASEIT